jgi:hypothetical protein
VNAQNEIAVLLCADQCRVTMCSTPDIWGLDPDIPEPNSSQRRLLREVASLRSWLQAEAVRRSPGEGGPLGRPQHFCCESQRYCCILPCDQQPVQTVAPPARLHL